MGIRDPRLQQMKAASASALRLFSCASGSSGVENARQIAAERCPTTAQSSKSVNIRWDAPVGDYLCVPCVQIFGLATQAA